MKKETNYKPRFWKTSEVRWLKDNVASKSLAELSAHLERSEGNKDDVCEAFVKAINRKISEVINLEIPSYKL